MWGAVDAAMQAATALAAAQPGVWEVTNDLLAESTLTRTVSEALARDPRTARSTIEVSSEGAA